MSEEKYVRTGDWFVDMMMSAKFIKPPRLVGENREFVKQLGALRATAMNRTLIYNQPMSFRATEESNKWNSGWNRIEKKLLDIADIIKESGIPLQDEEPTEEVK